jgi:hypothetical protein
LTRSAAARRSNIHPRNHRLPALFCPPLPTTRQPLYLPSNGSRDHAPRPPVPFSYDIEKPGDYCFISKRLAEAIRSKGSAGIGRRKAIYRSRSWVL